MWIYNYSTPIYRFWIIGRNLGIIYLHVSAVKMMNIPLCPTSSVEDHYLER